jgi:IS5 family transposase
VGVDLSRESVPDATTLLKFRRLLLANELTKALFDEINAHLAEQGLAQATGSDPQVGTVARAGRTAGGEHPGQGRHPFHVIKNLFHHKKVRYKGLAKNEAQPFSLANLQIAKRSLLTLHARDAS